MSNWLAALQVPNLKVGVQLQEFSFVVPEGVVRAAAGTITFSINYVETAGTYFVKNLRRNFKYDPEDDLERGPLDGKVVAPSDSYLGASEGFPGDAFDEALPPYNAIGSSQIPGEFKSGSMDPESFVNPINSRGHPGKGRSVLRFMRGIGHMFSVRSPAQLANVVGSRYLNRKKKASKPVDHDALLLVRAMVGEFFFEHVDSDISFDEDLLAQIETEADASAQIKHYDAQLRGISSPDFRLVRLHLKDIFKPSPKKNFDPEKPGQGISAWSKDGQVTFGTAIRYFNAVFQRALKAHVVFDNRMTTDQVFQRLSKAMSAVPMAASNGVTDFTMFDAQQDEFTQAIEKEFLRRVGASEEFIAHYYSMRKGYKISAGPLSGTAGTEKTSGEPGTLLFNSIVNCMMMNFLLRGEGPSAVAIKGDDGFKRQVNLSINEARRARVAAYTSLQIKISFEDPAEFCGCVIGAGAMAPNLYRRLVSVQGKAFKDYTSFALYQVSLRDWLKDIVGCGPERRAEVLALNTATFALDKDDLFPTFNSIEAVLDALISLSHISREQFEAAVHEHAEVEIHMSAAGPVFSGGAKLLSVDEIDARVRKSRAATFQNVVMNRTEVGTIQKVSALGSTSTVGVPAEVILTRSARDHDNSVAPRTTVDEQIELNEDELARLRRSTPIFPSATSFASANARRCPGHIGIGRALYSDVLESDCPDCAE
jgi:hypothetical protein